MKGTVRFAPSFEREAKALFKRFHGLKKQLKEYIKKLSQKAPRGDRIPGQEFLWKDRLPIKEGNIGKSGGLRIIMYSNEAVTVLIMIYYKHDKAQPSDKEMKSVVRELRAVLMGITTDTNA